MRKTIFFAILTVLLSSQILFAQEPLSLGEIARKIKVEKNGNVPAHSSGTDQQSPPAASASGRADVKSQVDPEKYGTEVSELFAQEKFKELDELAVANRSSKARFPGGGWKLFAFYRALEKPTATKALEAEWESHLVQLKRWVSVEPTAITAHTALAAFYLEYAWHARGTGLAGTVSDQGWKLFEERTQLAKGVLKHADSLKAKCPHWYYLMMSVALAESWDLDAASTLFTQAIAFAPDYYYYYQQRANYLLPQWHGEAGDAQKFALESANRVGGRAGDILYWQIAAGLSCGCHQDNPVSLMSWSRIRQGYASLIEQYGDSLVRQNDMAFMATYVGDAILADELFTAVGDQWDRSRWAGKEGFEKVKAWAASTSAALKTMMAIYKAMGENMQTPEGQKYHEIIAKEFEGRNAGMVKECLTAMPQDPGAFDVTLQIGGDGVLQQAMVYPDIGPSVCLPQRLRNAVFSPPPKPGYWVRVTMNEK